MIFFIKANSLDNLDSYVQEIKINVNSEIKPAFEAEFPTLLTFQYYSIESAKMPSVSKGGKFEILN